MPERGRSLARERRPRERLFAISRTQNRTPDLTWAPHSARAGSARALLVHVFDDELRRVRRGLGKDAMPEVEHVTVSPADAGEDVVDAPAQEFTRRVEQERVEVTLHRDAVTEAPDGLI